LDPQFKLVYLSVLGITILLLVASFIIAEFFGPMNEEQKSLFTMCTHGFGTGFGFLAGGYASQRSASRVKRG